MKISPVVFEIVTLATVCIGVLDHP